jgi:hypothetical protein
MNTLRGVVPMFPVSLGGLTPTQGRAIIDRKSLTPTIPVQFWAGTAPGLISTPANTPQYAPGTPSPTPGATEINAPIAGSTFTLTIGGQTVTLGLPTSGGSDCGC